MTLEQMIADIKAENPNGLRIGSEEDGYTQLSDAEAEVIFADWAKARLAKLQTEADSQASTVAKAELLDRLGITADEAKLLLG